MHGNFLVFENATDGDICADHGLDDGDVCARVEIVAIALEVLMWINANRCDQIASRCTLHASLTAVLDTNLLALVYTERNLDREVFAVGKHVPDLGIRGRACRWYAPCHRNPGR